MDVFLIGIYDDGMLYRFIDPADMELVDDHADAMEALGKVSPMKIEGHLYVDLDQLLDIVARGKINVVGTLEGQSY